MNFLLIVAGAVMFLAIVTGAKDNRGVFVPHGGYTWAACLFLLAFDLIK